MQRSHTHRFALYGALAIVLLPYVAILWLSLGSGWSFPRLMPDRLDLSPWRHIYQNKSSLVAAVANTIWMSLLVSLSSTLFGLSSGRALRRVDSKIGLFVAYLPFVLSPVVVGTVLYDLEARVGVVSTFAGVVAAQYLFAYSFATVFFYEMWDSRVDRLEALVQTLGGSRWAVWRHAIMPSVLGLMTVCMIQTAVFVWLDYGLVSSLGGGNVPTITLMLFSYLREASINQASGAALMLLVGSIAASILSAILLNRTRTRLGIQS